VERERVVEENKESDKSCPKEQHNLSAIFYNSKGPKISSQKPSSSRME